MARCLGCGVVGAALLVALAAPASAGTRPVAAGANSIFPMTTEASGPFPDTFNPFDISTYAGEIGSLIYEPLYQENYAKLQPIPWLATAYAWSNGGRTITFTIRRGVKLSLIHIFLVIPVLPLEIVLSSYLTNSGWVPITLIISLTAWPWGARTLRAQTLSIRKRDYVAAAIIAGDRTWRIVLYEILPNEIAIIVTGFLFQILFAIIVQTGLAFLGIGNVETWSWGSMLYFAQNSDAFFSGAWWWYVPPGLCVALVGMGLALTNIGIDEIINPKLRASLAMTRRERRRAAAPVRVRTVSAREILG